MKIDNSLTQEYLLRYPGEAARVLEKISPEHVAQFINEIPREDILPVIARMLPERAANCLVLLEISLLAKITSNLPVSSAARIVRHFPPARLEQLYERLSLPTKSRLQRYLRYSLNSVGALLDSNVDMLLENQTVAEAIRHIERYEHPVSYELYIINEAQQLVGVLELGSLMISRHHARLRDIMNRETYAISVNTTIVAGLAHPGWTKRNVLPVIDRDRTLLGVLDVKRLNEISDESQRTKAPDVFESLLSLSGLYWVSIAQLFDSILVNKKQGKGGVNEH